jgi:hypothetical protein
MGAATWKRQCRQRTIAPGVAAGVMFTQERTLDHDGWVRAARRAAEGVTAEQVGDAFLVERFFGMLKYEHLCRATISDGNALAVEVNLSRHTYNTLRPHQPSTNAHHARLTSPSSTAISVWPLADPLLDWEVLT